MKQPSVWVCTIFFHDAPLNFYAVFINSFLITYADDSVLFYNEKCATRNIPEPPHPPPGFGDCLCTNTFCSSFLLYASSLNMTHTVVVLLANDKFPFRINKMIHMCQWTTFKKCGSKSTIELNHDIFRIKKTCLYSIFQPTMKTSQSPCSLNIDGVIWTNTHTRSTPKHNLFCALFRNLFTLWFLWTLNRRVREGEWKKKQLPSHWVLLFVSQSKMTYDMKNDEKPVGRLPADWFSHHFILF